MSKKDKAPLGGWLPPPGNTEGLAPLATLKKGNKWRSNELTSKETKAHKRFQEAMKQADKEGRTHFEW